jgi:hypothetical protein
MKRITFLLAMLLLTASLAGAQTPAQALVKSFTGKVELLTAKQAWAPVRAGMRLALGTTISTGFNSTAVLELGPSVLQVKPLTRLRIDELVAKEGTVKTDLFLQVGKVRAEVKTAAGLTQDFKVKSPVSTAAVRGTGFEYDGYDLYVFEGTVTYSNLTGQSRSYAPGEQGGTDGYDTPSDAEQQLQSDFAVNPYTPGAGNETVTVPPVTGPGTGSVTIVIDPPTGA